MVDAKSTKAAPVPKGPRSFMAYLVEEHIWIFMVFIIPISMMFDILDFLRLRINVLLSALGIHFVWFSEIIKVVFQLVECSISDRPESRHPRGPRQKSSGSSSSMEWNEIGRSHVYGQTRLEVGDVAKALVQG